MAKNKKQKHLGRGLESLLGPINSTPQTQQTAEYEEIPVAASAIPQSPQQDDKAAKDGVASVKLTSIRPNPHQPRTKWDDTQLEHLGESIKVSGVIQPIVLRQAKPGYQIIAGERRFRAAEIAGLTEIPAIIRQATDEQMLEWALIENIHREDLNAIERAAAYKNYIESFSLNQTEAAERLGENRSVIANHLRLLDLPETVRQMLIDGKLSMGHARAILALPTDELRRKLANRALAERLSVREVERLIRKFLTSQDKPPKKEKTKPAHILDLERKLAAQLGTKVNIETGRGGKRGKIIVEFYTPEEFERLTESMGLAAVEQFE